MTRVAQTLIASAIAKLSVTKAKQHEGESTKTKSSHDTAVNNHIHEELYRKYAHLDAMGRTGHDVRSRGFKAQTHGWETRCDHDDPKDLDRADRKDRQVGRVFERQSYKEDDGLRNILCQKMLVRAVM